MIDLTPRTASEALRMAKTSEAAAKLDLSIWPNGDGTSMVDSWRTDENGSYRYTRYTVDLNNFSCTCPDYAKRGKYCKHLLKLQEIADAEVVEQEDQAFWDSMADGEAFMTNHHTERALAY